MNNSSIRLLLNKILTTADTMNIAELETVKREMKYSSVGSDYDHSYSPVPSYWGEINQVQDTRSSLALSVWSRFDTLSEEQFHIWNDFILRIEDLSNDVWRKAHAHKSK